MGVLDEAIREHLELKRRSGADPAEVARLEHEAFGPITREPVDPPPAPAPEAPGAEDAAAAGVPAAPHAADPADDDGFGAPFDDVDGEEQPPTAGAPHLGLGAEDPAAYAPPPDDLDAPYGHAGGGGPAGFGVPADDPAAAPHDPAPSAEDRAEDAGASRAWADDDWTAPPSQVDQPTQAYSVDDLEELRRVEEGAPAPDPDVVPADAEAHDELEETPEFLEETPEHDRLWFEQKPPKDFDF